MIFNVGLSGRTQSSRLQRPRREGKYTRGITSDPIPVSRVRSSVLCCPPDFLPATKGQRKRATLRFLFFHHSNTGSAQNIDSTRNLRARIAKVHEKVCPGFSRKSNSYELARLREAISLDEFMRDIIS